MRARSAALAATLALAAACLAAGSPISAAPAARAAGSITIGIHDGSINNCDNGEKWLSSGPVPRSG